MNTGESRGFNSSLTNPWRVITKRMELDYKVVMGQGQKVTV